MMDDALATLVHHEPTLRLTVFLGLLATLTLAEARFPRRIQASDRGRRWTANLGLVLAATLVLRLALPLMPVTLAAGLAGQGWGLLPALGLATGPLGLIVALLLLDLSLWVQHWATHRVPLLWRLHRVHHTDLALDTTTAVRFHPLEILASALWRLLSVAALAPSAGAVVLFEILVNAAALFNHANLSLPPGLDRVLRRGMVTPDMHRIHHSIHPEETNRNFGVFLPWWDRLFGTYADQPRDGHAAMRLGLAETRDPGRLGLIALVRQPFRARL